jgi:DNA segregation ATPase FtsK/SpoIIIE, S-DNA-T family
MWVRVDFPDGEFRLLEVTKAIVFGRSSQADFPVIGATDASRKHFELFVRFGWLHLRDLGSSNGTRVNGTRVMADPVRIRGAAKVHMGTYELRIRHTDAPTASPAANSDWLVSLDDDDEDFEDEPTVIRKWDPSDLL